MTGFTRFLILILIALGLSLASAPPSHAIFGLFENDEGAEEEKVDENLPPPVPDEYLPLPVLVVPIDTTQWPYFAYVHMQIVLEVANISDLPEVKDKLVHLQDAIILDFHDRLIGKPDDPTDIDFEGIKRRIKTHCDGLMGKGYVTDVLIQQAVYSRG